MQETIGSRGEKLAFYKMTARITLPIAFQNLMDACVSSADVLMMMLVGKTQLAASSLAGQVAFVLHMLLYGISSGASILSSQYWGIRDTRAIERVMALSLKVSISLGILFSLAAGLFPRALMRVFTDDEALIAEGVKYLRAVCPSYALTGFTTVYLSVMRSVERVRMSAAVHSGAVVMNVVLNACFIFGWGFFPKLDIAGVALATSITRLIEACVCAADTALCKMVKLRLKDFVARKQALLRDFLRYSLPAAANDIIWGLAFSVYSAILGRLSGDIVAANSVAGVVRSLSTVVCFGVSSAGAIILGKTMGANQLERSRAYASRFVKLSVVTAILGGLIILACRPLVLGGMHYLVEVNDTVTRYVGIMLWINAYYILGQSVNTMLICGVFRAGGDVRFGLVCDFIAMWAYAVPVGLICAFVLKLPEIWVYFILCLDEFVKMPVVIAHYKKRGWARNLTRANPNPG